MSLREYDKLFACVKLGNDYVLFEKVTRASTEIYLTLLFQEKKMEYFRHMDDNKPAGWRHVIEGFCGSESAEISVLGELSL